MIAMHSRSPKTTRVKNSNLKTIEIHLP